MSIASLVLHPGGFEGVFAVEVDPLPDDEAIAQLEHPAEFALHDDAAGSARRNDPVKGDYKVLVGIDVLVNLPVDLRPLLLPAVNTATIRSRPSYVSPTTFVIAEWKTASGWRYLAIASRSCALQASIKRRTTSTFSCRHLLRSISLGEEYAVCGDFLGDPLQRQGVEAKRRDACRHKRTAQKEAHMSTTNGGEPAVPDETLRDTDRTASDADQTIADLDQTAADDDQALANLDQEQSNLDQVASERDQETADREEAAHRDSSAAARKAYADSREERDAGTLARDATTLARAVTGAERLDRAARRDHNAGLRDLTAQARDLAAEALDRAALEQEQAEDVRVSPRDRKLHDAAMGYMGQIREDATQLRARAAADRASAAGDRERAAQDREEAAADRQAAQAALRVAHLDELTGAYRRGIGLVALQNEIDRARRTDKALVLAFVDVDDLKTLNDRDGHAAGDALLRAVCRALRSKMRSYEPIVRFGGDEFVCAFGDINISAARERFKEIQAVLDRDPDPGTFGVGLASLEPDDSLDDLIGRADRALVEVRAA
jgi:diguanylate cyclase (GGDEF)-like protein